MSDIIPNGPARFYRHSGRIPPKALAGGLGAAVGLGLVCGAVYGYAGLYAHTIPLGKIAFALILLGTVGLGVGIGGGLAKLLCRWNARSNAVAVGLSVLGSLAALYAAWVMYLFALLQYAHQPASVWIIARPDILWSIIEDANAAGVWSFGKDRPTGVLLGLIWLTEAGLVLVTAGKFVLRGTNVRVFCEHCQKWGCEKREIMQISAADSAKLKSDLREGRLDSLCATPAKQAGAAVWCDVLLEGCADCDDLQTLTVEHWTRHVDRNGRNSPKRTFLARRLLLNAEQTLAVIQAAAALRTPTAESAAEPAEPEPAETPEELAPTDHNSDAPPPQPFGPPPE